MYLSKLEIFGFKTFPVKTTIHFTRGITGIVGPNGCGKTNIVDAIRWCLGEQKTSMLRSDKMEDVIFNGTKERKPMGMAEVSLSIFNDDHILPSEYSEVTITRRIFRSGESEYLLNKNICRLKDITNLFMDTGMGTNAYSVIELKMIGTIINNKADELRKMFEEAAGVNKYKLRRRLTYKKLDEVKSDLNRVNDIVTEVERTVRSLERQAKKANKYNQLRSILNEKDLELAEREYTTYQYKINQHRENESLQIKEKELIDNDIHRAERELIELREKINQIDKIHQAKQDEISEQNNKIYSLRNSISLNLERLNSLENNLDRFQKELDEFHLQKEEATNTTFKSKEKEESLKKSITLKENEIAENSINITQEKEILDHKRSEIKEINDNLTDIQREVNEKETKLTSFHNQIEKNNIEIERLNQNIQNYTNNIAKTVGYLEELETEENNLTQSFKTSESHYVEKQNDKLNIESKLNELRSSEIEEKSSIENVKDKIEFIQSLINNLEGISKGSKLLLESKGWTENEKVIFADLGNTDDKYRFALEVALKTVLNNLLIEDMDELNQAIDYLQKNDLGKASFYFLNQKTSNGLVNKFFGYIEKKKVNNLEKQKGFLSWAASLVETDKKWQPYFNAVLGKTAIIDNLENAMLLHTKFPQFNYATVNGDIIRNNGIIEAGSLPKSDETLFGRRKFLEQLKNELPKYENNLFKLRTLIEETEGELNKIDLDVLSEKGKLLLNDLNNVQKQISQFDFERNKYSEVIESTQNEIQKYATESSLLSKETTNLESDLSLLYAKKNKTVIKLETFENELKVFESGFNLTNEEQNERKVELERLKGQLENTYNEIERAENNIVILEKSIGKRETDIQSSNEKISTTKNIIDETESDFSTISEVYQSLLSEKNIIGDDLSKLKDESSEYEDKLNQLRNQRQKISDEIHNIEIILNENKLRSESLAKYIQEEYSVELVEKEFEDLESFDFDTASNEVQELKLKLKNLGPINLLAYSEYEEEKERLDFLSKQRNDLIESEKDLAKTIEEINDTAQKLFLDSFEAITINFKKTFQKLFNPGDEADLTLEEGVDPLEAKIDIIAKPKGKRPSSIDLISQGEKTLTATALLFAIYLVKPSPFCILDEVDAPLDDANVGRFMNLITDFSKETQFIMITHNKKTMEAAENMYGVTMQEEGISKLAAVQFNEQIPLNN